MKLWQKDNTQISALVHEFTVGPDKEFDAHLAKYDVQGSMAHITMLEHVGLLPNNEFLLLKQELENILASIEKGTFSIREDAEDIHSQVEQMVTDQLGDAGKKIHSGRSRNDQVAVDIKLYLQQEILQIKTEVVALFGLLQNLSEQHKGKLLPGYTHLQLAMPSSFGLRPDIIPPITPVITDVYVTDRSVTLQIAQSTSEDVAGHIIYRKTNENDPWETIKRTGPVVTSLTDTNVKKGAIYYYSLRAKDSTGLYSDYANVMYGKPYDNGMLPPVQNIKIDTAGESVLLKWDYANMSAGTSFVIYKKDSKGNLKQYGRTTERSFTDKGITKENSYAIQVMTNDGGQSPMSEVVSKRMD